MVLLYVEIRFLGSCLEFWGPILGPVFGPSFGAFLFGFVNFGAGEASSFWAVRNQPGGQFLDHLLFICKVLVENRFAKRLLVQDFK